MNTALVESKIAKQYGFPKHNKWKTGFVDLSYHTAYSSWWQNGPMSDICDMYLLPPDNAQWLLDVD
jgi:hypothetical protein